jgi:hypothetical protein
MLLPVRCSHCGHVSASRVSVSAAGDVIRDEASDRRSDALDLDCPMCGGVLGAAEESSAIALLADLTNISASVDQGQHTAFVATLRDSLDKLQAEDVVRARVEREAPAYQPVMDQIPKFGVNFLSWASLVLALTTANGRSETPQPPPEPSADPVSGAEPDMGADAEADAGIQPAQRGSGRRAPPITLYTIDDVSIDGESLTESESPRAQHSGYPLWMASLDSRSSTCKLSGRLIYSQKAQAMDRPRLFVAYYLGSAFHKSWQARLVPETPDCDSWSVRIHLSRETRGGWCYIYTSDKVILGGVEIRRWVRYVVTKT